MIIAIRGSDCTCCFQTLFYGGSLFLFEILSSENKVTWKGLILCFKQNKDYIFYLLIHLPSSKIQNVSNRIMFLNFSDRLSLFSSFFNRDRLWMLANHDEKSLLCAHLNTLCPKYLIMLQDVLLWGLTIQH